MNYGFVIDNRACIGCHACSTACKGENEVPLGVYRTWVKYTESGEYPNTQRHFQVTRCNHCANPPCVRICPTQAMYQRDDGIVEFDNRSCIGCKACLQACPYDAIHIDPSSGTAAKCHYCSHRVEIGLEPSCVVVCPTHAIIAGDMDDAESEISRILSRAKTSVRKPEQGTAPKLFYVDGADTTMVPSAVTSAPETFMWADVQDASPSPRRAPASTSQRQNRSGVPLRAAQQQGMPARGPIVVGGRRAEHMVQVGYNAQHRVPWHWPVPAYLVTKGMAAGLFTLLALAWLTDFAPFHAPTAVAAGVAVTVLMIATTALLVFDLEKPERFLYILLRPQWRSWLTRGALFLIGFSSLAGLWTAAELAAHMSWIDPGIVGALRSWLLALGVPLAAGVAVYTAFLFGQAEGRDLWQNPLLPVHLLVQAAMMGGAALSLVSTFVDLPAQLQQLALVTLAVALVVDLVVLLLGDVGMSHASDVAASAAHEMTDGRYRILFWVGAVLAGHVVPLVALVVLPAAAVPVAALMAVAGLYSYEHAFVMAPQRIPNS